jgi:hypothetical protein
MAQWVLVGRYYGVDVVEGSERVNHFFGCFDGIVGEGPFIKRCWLLVDGLLLYHFYACMGGAGRCSGLSSPSLWGACLLVHKCVGSGLLTVIECENPSIPVIHKLESFQIGVGCTDGAHVGNIESVPDTSCLVIHAQRTVQSVSYHLLPSARLSYSFSQASDKAFDVLYMGLTSGSTAMIDENRASGNLIHRPSG